MCRFFWNTHAGKKHHLGEKNEKIEATFDKGVLQITLPKTEEAKKKEIKIKVK